MKNNTKYKNNYYGLNEILALRQGLTQDDFDRLVSLYDDAICIIKQIETCTDNDYTDLLSKLSATEFAIQEGWGFKRDASMHYFSFTPKNCTCPKLDNIDLKGTDRRIYNASCPIHKLK